MFGYVATPSKALRLKDCVSLDGYSRQYPHARLVGLGQNSTSSSIGRQQTR
jgi:hypothetical protein